jgi:hypothetical protein
VDGQLHHRTARPSQDDIEVVAEAAPDTRALVLTTFGRPGFRRARWRSAPPPSFEIARRRFLSEGRVRNYLTSAIGKTGARTRVEAAQVAAERGRL